MSGLYICITYTNSKGIYSCFFYFRRYTNIEATHLIEKFGAKLAFDCDPREGILHYNVQIEKINNNAKK